MLRHLGSSMIGLAALAVALLCSQAALGANWYVDNAVATPGNGQSWSGAFKSFSSIDWSAISAGDTLFISGGTATETYTSWLTVRKSGVAGDPITIRVGQEAGHNGRVVFSGAGIDVSNQNYVTVDGSVGGVGNLVVQDVTDSDKDNGWAIYASGTTGVVLRYIKTLGCNNGFYLVRSTAYEIAYCDLSSRGDAGVRGILSTGGWDANVIHHNRFESLFNGGGPDMIQVGDGTTIHHNVFEVTQSASAMPYQHTDDLQLAGSKLKIYANEFVNIGDSMIDYDAWASGALRDVWIYNNVFRQVKNIDPYPEYIRIYSTGRAFDTVENFKILNNTFLDERATNRGNWTVIKVGGLKGGSASGIGNEIRNNLFIGTGDLGIGTPPTISYGGNVYPRAQSSDPSGVVAVPALGADLVPLPTDTVARDKGTSLDVFFTDDKNGTPRPQGSAWDIGAFEYAPGTAAKRPAAPTGLTVAH